MEKLIKILFWALVVFFCWGWHSNVYSGKMTMGQYLRKIQTDCQHAVGQAVTNETDKVLKSKKVAPVVRSVQTLYGGSEEPKVVE